MSGDIRTFDFDDVKVNMAGIALTDILDAVTIEESGDVWEETEGVNGDVDRIRHKRKMVKVTVNFMQNSPQLAALEAMQIADEKTKAGPYPFALAHLGGTYALVGRAWIKSNRNAKFGNSLSGRTVVLSVYKDAGFAGA